MTAVMDWKEMPESREKYSAYLASREWAVKKLQVKARSGGRCEHCLVADGTQTHHQTYQRKYQERLDDLLHVCAPCHEYLSGHGTNNPALARPPYICQYTGDWSLPVDSVYLAGKITGSTWRDEILPGWSRGDVGSCDQSRWWNTKHKVITAGERVIDMEGPWWFDMNQLGKHVTSECNECEHASGHWGKHGLEINKRFVFVMAEQAIRHASVVFAWLDSTDCHGTLAEIGIARGLAKPVFVFAANDRIANELWFALEAANNCTEQQVQPSAGEAWKYFIKNYTR